MELKKNVCEMSTSSTGKYICIFFFLKMIVYVQFHQFGRSAAAKHHWRSSNNIWLYKYVNTRVYFIMYKV